MTCKYYVGIFDFRLMPYALGDVLTWNVQTAILCNTHGREKVNIYLCMDQDNPSNIYQTDLVTRDNCWLFSTELIDAFKTHPKLGNVYLYTNGDDLRKDVSAVCHDDEVNESVLNDYTAALSNLDDEDARISYFTKYIYYHDRINEYATKNNGKIPILQSSRGCEPDVHQLFKTVLSGKKVVAIHLRQRRLDEGMKGEHTHSRDSNFISWYDFLSKANVKYPNVVFIAIGRLQEKPLIILNLPNVINLRVLGMGLGHELTAIVNSDLFIGTSSGFAAMANFTEVPYFITRMNKESYNAYSINESDDRLPFANEFQKLIDKQETTDLLFELLAKGLNYNYSSKIKSYNDEIEQCSGSISDIKSAATTSRFFSGVDYCQKETLKLIKLDVNTAKELFALNKYEEAQEILHSICEVFPKLINKSACYLRLNLIVAYNSHNYKDITCYTFRLLRHGPFLQLKLFYQDKVLANYLLHHRPRTYKVLHEIKKTRIFSIFKKIVISFYRMVNK